MKQQSIYLRKQRLNTWSPPTQYDWEHKHNSHCKQLLSPSYQRTKLFTRYLLRDNSRRCLLASGNWTHQERKILALHAALPAHVMALLDWKRANELPYGVSQRPILAGALVWAVGRGGEKKQPCRGWASPGTCWAHSQVRRCNQTIRFNNWQWDNQK